MFRPVDCIRPTYVAAFDTMDDRPEPIEDTPADMADPTLPEKLVTAATTPLSAPVIEEELPTIEEFIVDMFDTTIEPSPDIDVEIALLMDENPEDMTVLFEDIVEDSVDIADDNLVEKSVNCCGNVLLIVAVPLIPVTKFDNVVAIVVIPEPARFRTELAKVLRPVETDDMDSVVPDPTPVNAFTPLARAVRLP